MSVLAVVGSGRTSSLGLVGPAFGRSVRGLTADPASALSPVFMSLFFLLVYVGQLAGVGSAYLGQERFATFLLPLVLVSGAATGAATAATAVARDMVSGYLPRLRLAAGTDAPFLAGTLLAGAVALAVQTALMTLAGVLVGFETPSAGRLLHLVGLATAYGTAVSVLATAAAVRWRQASVATLVSTTFFGLCFFTGVFAPTDELAPWMRAVAGLNPVTPVLEGMRALTGSPNASGTTLAAWVAVASIALVGCGALALARRHERIAR